MQNKQDVSDGRTSMRKCEFAIRQLLRETSMMTEKEEASVGSIYDLSVEDRWRLYRYENWYNWYTECEYCQMVPQEICDTAKVVVDDILGQLISTICEMME